MLARNSGADYLACRGHVVYRDVFDKEHYTDFGFSCSLSELRSLKVDPLSAMNDGFARYETYPPEEKK